MPSYKRPDIYISEFLNPSNVFSEPGVTATAFVGPHFRGPTGEAVYVRSWTHFQALYGGFPTTGVPSELPYAVYNYFGNGGRGTYVLRLTGAGAAPSSAMLVDRTAGTPLSTLRVLALNAGVWGNDIRISIVDRDAPNGRFDLVVFRGGTTDAFIVERWDDLSMNPADSRYVEAIINSPSAGSGYVMVDDQGAASALPARTPAVQSGTALTGGADGAAVGNTEYNAAFTIGTSPFDGIEDVVTLNMPGVSTAATVNAALTYAEAVGTYFVVIDPPVGAPVASAVTYAGTLSPSSYGALYTPWITVPDPNSNTPGATRLCPPGAFVQGKIAETDATRGVWKAPAGLNTSISNVVSLERRFTNLDLDSLNEAHVNAIRQVPGAGVVVMGARTLKKRQSDKYVNVRRTLNYLKDSLVSLTEFALFETNDFALWDQLTATVTRFLSQMHAAGGLKGARPEQAFYVKCDEELNTPAVIAAGEVRMEIGVALQNPAEFVVIRIGQWEGGQSATEA